mgnify:CR=1 FL=1
MKNKGKIGGLFLVSILAFASISVSYASVTGGLEVQGVTPTVVTELSIKNYTRTDVYKIWGISSGIDIPDNWESGVTDSIWDQNNEILVIRGVVGEIPDETEVIDWAQSYGGDGMKVSWASAEEGDTIYDVNLTYENVFPGIDFTAGFIFEYSGITVKIDDITFEHEDDDDFTEYLSYKVSNVTKENNQWVVTDDASNFLFVEITLQLDQNNDLQGLAGTFTGEIHVSQRV